MAETAPLDPNAMHHLPPFIAAPGETDVLFVVTAFFLLLAVIGIGVLYLKLHALPEQMAHRGQKVQFEIVAVLGLLALFTHNHVFWIAGLLLALVPIPDVTTPLSAIASSLDRIAAAGERQDPSPTAPERPAAPPPVPVVDEHAPAGQQGV